MKSLLVLMLTSFLLFSCAHVYFTEVQPSEGEHLKEIPKELQGEWKTGEYEILRVDASGMTTINNKEEKITSIRTPLSDTFQLYMTDGIYVFNYKELNSPWEIMVVKVQENGDIHLYQCLDPKIFEKDKNLSLANSIYEVDGEEQNLDHLPSGEEYQFVQATFSGQMDRETLQSIMKEENLVNILKMDGTSYSPSDNSSSDE